MGKSPENQKRNAANWLLLGTLILGATGVRLGIQNPEHPDTNEAAPAAETVPSPEESNIHQEEPDTQSTPNPPLFLQDEFELPTPPASGNAIPPTHGAF